MRNEGNRNVACTILDDPYFTSGRQSQETLQRHQITNLVRLSSGMFFYTV